MAAKFTKPWRLTEKEDFPSFQSWQTTIIYYLTHGDNIAYKQYFDTAVTPNWQRADSDDPNRGLAATAGEGAQTAVQRKDQLESLLKFIAQHAPQYLATQIVEDSTGMDFVWQLIREYYGFASSELTFMTYYSIQQEEGERPQRLYHRLISHVRDNLLQKDGVLKHNGVIPQKQEVMSPTLERMIVLRWLELLHPRLPGLVMRNFSYDLTIMTLKDLQPRICQTLPTLLAQLREEESSIHAVFSRGGRFNNFQNQNRYNGTQAQQRSNNNQQPRQATKFCKLCHAAKRPTGHSMADCDYISAAEKRDMAQVRIRQVDAGTTEGEVADPDVQPDDTDK